MTYTKEKGSSALKIKAKMVDIKIKALWVAIMVLGGSLGVVGTIAMEISTEPTIAKTICQSEGTV